MSSSDELSSEERDSTATVSWVSRILENRTVAIVVVALALIPSAGLVALWLIFGLAAAGNEGASDTAVSNFLVGSLLVFAAYVLLCIGLLWKRQHVIAMLVAWAPIALFVVVPK